MHLEPHIQFLYKYKYKYVQYVKKTNLSQFLDQTEPQKTTKNQFLAVSVRFYKILNKSKLVSVSVHPKSGEKLVRTGPLNPIHVSFWFLLGSKTWISPFPRA